MKWRTELDQARGEVLLPFCCCFLRKWPGVLFHVLYLTVSNFVLSCADCKEGRLRRELLSLGLLGSGAGEWCRVRREM